MQQLQQAVRQEAEHNIFAYWLKLIDREKGGFYCYADFEGRIDKTHHKGVLLHSRILWAFSAAYRRFGKKEYLDAATHCFNFLTDKALDKEFGGVYWLLNADCQPIDTQKHVYNQSFAIYALSEYYLATQNEQALKICEDLFRLIEKHAYDAKNGGYLEAYDRQWQPIENHLVCDTSEEILAEKSMNTHLHILEAYTNLYRSNKSMAVYRQILMLLQLFRDKIIREDFHYGLFFSRDWQCVSQDISYGHDIEGSWLIDEATRLLTDENLKAKMLELTLKMARVTLAQGVDKDGAIFNEFRHGHLIDADRIWWVQAEAMVGFYNAYQKSQASELLEAARNCWRIIQSDIVDRKNGEWFWKTDRQGVPYTNEPKIEPWKCPYHNGRACLELDLRLAQD